MRFLLIAALIPSLFTLCTDKVPTRESDLIKYPEMAIFYPKMKDFKSGWHDLDVETFSFSFSSAYEDAPSFFRVVDSAATANDWKIVFESNEKREYTGLLQVYKAGTENIKVSLTYDNDGRISYYEERVHNEEP